MDLSVVVPLYNERDNLAPLHEELTRSLRALGRSFEVIYVDDGSTDGGIEVLRQLRASDPAMHVIRLARNSGQTAALSCGFNRARGDVIIAMDADMQNNPADIPLLLARIGEGYDIVSGWRTERWQDEKFTRRMPSMAANWLISTITGIALHDYGCTYKAYRRETAQGLNLYGEMHRFVPAIAAEQGAKVTEVPISFRPRHAGTSKYGLWRIVRTLLDLITVKFLSVYSTAPIQVFGLIGLGLSALGSLWTLMLVGEKVFFGAELSKRPALLLSVLLIVVGVQFISFGLLGEMLARTYHESQGKPIYLIKEEF
jgi:glycosyltransferase involved in cell wall biosynthesis